jgi:NDP-sugar pyrophosphorylase family protein
MKAMVLAAGLGTRLKPLTDDRPKALVEIAGRTLLEITLSRLQKFGVSEAIVNVHHFANKIVDYLQANKNFGMRIEISREVALLDTGGGLKKAAWFFHKDSAHLNEPFVLHNVDVISTIDLQAMLEAHTKSRALATLAVQQRDASRQLFFDEVMQLCGRGAGRDAKPEIVRRSPNLQALAFTGIHVISPQLLALMTEEGAFSIINTYVRLVAQNEIIRGYRADQSYWRDLGKQEELRQAESDFNLGKFV